jgi:hypothetical protein
MFPHSEVLALRKALRGHLTHRLAQPGGYAAPMASSGGLQLLDQRRFHEYMDQMHRD